MPSGRTHDRITLWSLPFVTGITFEQTQSSKLTLLVAGAFLFSGLMFGPDLDLYSVQYKRWGWMRWIWLPYQKLLRHRSLLSHGPIIGTTLRVLYLAIWLGIIVGITTSVWCMQWKWQMLAQSTVRSLTHHSTDWLAFALGLELGAMSHVISDWVSSAYKRCRNQRWSVIPHGKMKKKKSLARVTHRSKPATTKNRQKY
ncbi:MAG: metal-binding protein [Chroococcidiopsidaceae cyanobacterium CP_BM_ER_R8_30]|nr:metal-binding protein [Chroococcidiopsidaceae cyanobacterium CP_BM_ER_R8_30]